MLLGAWELRTIAAAACRVSTVRCAITFRTRTRLYEHYSAVSINSQSLFIKLCSTFHVHLRAVMRMRNPVFGRTPTPHPCSQYRTLPLVYSPAHADVTTSHHCCASYTGCQFRDDWIEFKIACLVHTYLTTDIHLVSEYGRRPLRSSTDRTLTVPRTHNRFGDRSFAAGPRLSNSLPISLRQISSSGQFRRHLKNHLFGI